MLKRKKLKNNAVESFVLCDSKTPQKTANLYKHDRKSEVQTQQEKGCYVKKYFASCCKTI